MRFKKGKWIITCAFDNDTNALMAIHPNPYYCETAERKYNGATVKDLRLGELLQALGSSMAHAGRDLGGIDSRSDFIDALICTECGR